MEVTLLIEESIRHKNDVRMCDSLFRLFIYLWNSHVKIRSARSLYLSFSSAPFGATNIKIQLSSGESHNCNVYLLNL
jgi:hypothetical protein